MSKADHGLQLVEPVNVVRERAAQVVAIPAVNRDLDSLGRFVGTHIFGNFGERGTEGIPFLLGVLRDLGLHVVGAERVDEILFHETRVIECGGVDFDRAFFADFREEDGDALPGGGVGGIENEGDEGNEIADVLAFEKLHAAGYGVRDAGLGECELDFEGEEMRAVEENRNRRKTLRESLILFLIRIRGKHYTTKAVVDLYFRLSTPITRLNLWRHRVFPRNYPQPVKLNIGSGPQYLQGFINIEGMLPWKKDIWLDVRRGLPFKNASVDVIYSCHVFEHFDLKTLRHIFSECYRVLKPGGRIRFVTPSLTKAIEAYKRHEIAWFPEESSAWNLKSLGGRFNDVMLCQNHHLLLPDFSLFEELLNEAGPWAKLIEGGPEQSEALLPKELVSAEKARLQGISNSLVVEGTKAFTAK